jgi:squalene-hopene/tetraprenyl-beta-curcumene cyclase
LPFDRSSTDITAHALRALAAWRDLLHLHTSNATYARRIDVAQQNGISYLQRQQQADGCWLPLWFGNQHDPREANPVYGTSRVLVMCHELGLGQTEMARRAVLWLTKVQHVGGGWGAVVSRQVANKPIDPTPELPELICSVEETALAVEALLPFAGEGDQVASAVEQGVLWLSEGVLAGRHFQAAPIGFYFAKLWYYERLYPQIFATRALECATREGQKTSATVGAAH